MTKIYTTFVLSYFFSDLKSLTVSLQFDEDHDEITKPIISHVSEIYGFAPLRQQNQLKVAIKGADVDDEDYKSNKSQTSKTLVPLIVNYNPCCCV